MNKPVPVPRVRYVVLALLLLCLMAFHAANGQWAGDFWEHSAAVRELASKPLRPAHPILAVRLPHSSYSPYLLGVALLSRLAGLGPVNVMAAAGLANLVIFLASFYVFSSLLLDRQGAPFYALLFALLLWGSAPWEYSGFFHLGVLGYILPYPSTAAAALVFAALSLHIVLIRSGKRLWLVPISALATLVLLTHTLTFVVLCVGLASITIGAEHLSVAKRPADTRPHRIRQYPSRLDIVLLLGALVASVLIALAWPYYPLAELVLRESSTYHASNRPMYDQILSRTWPALLGLPFVLLRLRTNWRDALAWMILGLALVYGYGALTGRWSYGREISYLVLLLQMAVADRVAQIESWLCSYKVAWSRLCRWAFLPLIAGLLFLLSFKSLIQPALERCLPGQPSTYGQYTFLTDWTGQHDVVLADLETGWMVPTFGGKTVASLHPLAFVPDHQVRQKEVRYFFSDLALDDARIEIARRYGVDYLLLDKRRAGLWPQTKDPQAIAHALAPWGEVVLSNEEFALIALHSLNRAATSEWLLSYPLAEPPQHTQLARFGQSRAIELLGYSVEWARAAEGETSEATSRNLVVTLYWRASSPAALPYDVFVHLLDAAGSIRGQTDGQPLEGRYPTHVWPASVVVRDERIISVPVDALPGVHRLAVGLYKRTTMERLPAFDEAGEPWPDGRVILSAFPAAFEGQ